MKKVLILIMFFSVLSYSAGLKSGLYITDEPQFDSLMINYNSYGDLKVFKDGKMDKEKTDLEQLLEDEKHNPPVKGRNAPGADKHQVHLQQNDNDKDKNTGNGKGKN